MATTSTTTTEGTTTTTAAPRPPDFVRVWSLVPSPSTSCLLVAEGDTVYALHNEDLPLIPASTLKLVVAAADPDDERVPAILRDSDNDAARALVEDLGGVHAVLDRIPLDFEAGSVVVRDATGHDRGNRVTCTALRSILLRHDFRDSLAVAGESGTLRDRFVEHRGLIAAKTGSIGGVAALAGYAGPVVFAMVLNGVDDAAPVFEALVDELVLIE